MVNSNVNIAKFIQELVAPSFSHMTIQNISTFILGLTPKRNQILKELKQENYAQSDETGLRVAFEQQSCAKRVKKSSIAKENYQMHKKLEWKKMD